MEYEYNMNYKIWKYGKIYNITILFWNFTILSRFFVVLVLLLCMLSEQYSQTNFPFIKPFKLTKKGTADIYNNLLHLYSAFLGTQSALHRSGGISSTTTNVQHPPGWCDGSHSAPEHPPHTSLLVERKQSDEANQCMEMIMRPWWSKANLGKSGQR